MNVMLTSVWFASTLKACRRKKGAILPLHLTPAKPPGGHNTYALMLLVNLPSITFPKNARQIRWIQALQYQYSSHTNETHTFFFPFLNILGTRRSLALLWFFLYSILIIYLFLHLFIYSFIYSYIYFCHIFIYSLIHSYIYLLIYLFIHSFSICLSIYISIYPFISSLIFSIFINSFICWRCGPTEDRANKQEWWFKGHLFHTYFSLFLKEHKYIILLTIRYDKYQTKYAMITLELIER